MDIVIVGVTGQDGQLLARHLTRLGHRIIGIGRKRQAPTSIVDFLSQYCAIDVGVQSSEYSSVLHRVKPSVVFYTAAVHGPSGTQLEHAWESLQATTILGLHHTLEYARQHGHVRVINFSSSRVFGLHHGTLLTEQTPRRPDDIYGVVKNSADELVDFYFRVHAVKATSLVLFNHESSLRGGEFFSRKLVEAIQNLINGRDQQHSFETFDFWKDWGLADEYMGIVAQSFQIFNRPAYVVATGRTTYTTQLVSDVCQEIGVDSREILKLSKASEPQNTLEGVTPWTALPAALLQDTGLSPIISGKDVFLSLLREMRDEA